MVGADADLAGEGGPALHLLDMIEITGTTPAVLDGRADLAVHSAKDMTSTNAAGSPRSAYILRDAARWGWQHSVPPTKVLRYSVTFRTARR